jgi:hypothetical protein
MEPADQPTISSPSGPAQDQLRTYRIRPWLVAITALLTELVVIAAVDNQGVAGALRNYLDDPAHRFADYSRGALDAALTFSWRFAPDHGQATHGWAAQLAGIGTLLLLTLLAVAVVARGVGGFGRVLVSVWAVVAILTPVAIMVRNVIVVPSTPGPLQSRVGQSVYGYQDFGPVLVAGLALGLVTALVAAIVALLSRRPVGGPAGRTELQDEEAGEYFDTAFAPRYDTEATTQFPRTPQERGPDEQPAYQQSGSQQPGAYGQPAGYPQPYGQPPAEQQTYRQQPGYGQPAYEPAPYAQPQREPAAPESVRDQPVRDETARYEPVAPEQATDPQAADHQSAGQQAADQPTAEQRAVYPDPPTEREPGGER